MISCSKVDLREFGHVRLTRRPDLDAIARVDNIFEVIS